MTKAELIKALEGVPDDAEINVDGTTLTNVEYMEEFNEVLLS